VYEITVGPDIPCIFMPSISRYPNEKEIVLAPDLHFTFDSKIHFKYRSMNAKIKGMSTRIAIIHTEVRAPIFDERKSEEHKSEEHKSDNSGGRKTGGHKSGRKTRKIVKQRRYRS